MNKTEVVNILQQAGFSGYVIEQACASGNLSEIKTPSQLASIVSRTYPPLGNNNNMTAIDLLKRPAFQLACQVPLVRPSSPPEFVKISRSLKYSVFYGSTSGLNIAEVMETGRCSDYLKMLSLPSRVIFDHTGHDSPQATIIREDSIKVIPEERKADYLEFVDSLGKNRQDQSIEAAKQLIPRGDLVFVETEEVNRHMGSSLNLFRVCVMAKVSGSDPFILHGQRASKLLAELSMDALLQPVGGRNDLAGFSLYARDVILGDNPNSALAIPLKLTNKANIYFLLEREKALLGQIKPDSGVLVMPITRHRIQTPSQIELQTGDPVDPTVLAYLAQREPGSWQKLVTEFTDSCQVLTPDQAIQEGTGDVRFNIANYFNL